MDADRYPVLLCDRNSGPVVRPPIAARTATRAGAATAIVRRPWRDFGARVPCSGLRVFALATRSVASPVVIGHGERRTLAFKDAETVTALRKADGDAALPALGKK